MNLVNSLEVIEELKQERSGLTRFIRHLGFDPAKVAVALNDNDESFLYKSLALNALKVECDFSGTPFSQRGMDESIKWFNQLRAPDAPAIKGMSNQYGADKTT